MIRSQSAQSYLIWGLIAKLKDFDGKIHRNVYKENTRSGGYILYNHSPFYTPSEKGKQSQQ